MSEPTGKGESQSPISEALTNLINQAFEAACESIAEGDALVPFVMTEGADGEDVRRFAVLAKGARDEDDVDFEASVEAAEKHMRGLKGKADRAVMAFDATLTMEEDGDPVDHVVVDAFETGGAKVYRVALPYKQDEDGEGFEILDEPMVIDDGEALW